MNKLNHSLYAADVAAIINLKPGEFHICKVKNLQSIRVALWVHQRKQRYEKGVHYRHIKVSADIAHFYKTNSTVNINAG